jgi:hypothetical protein
MTNAGRCERSMMLAMVKVFPVTVAPSRVWNRYQESNPSIREAIAVA